MALVLSSPTFADGRTIPTKYTCDGENVSPPFNGTVRPPKREASF